MEATLIEGLTASFDMSCRKGRYIKLMECESKYLKNSISIGNESVPEIIINDNKKFFLNCYQHFGNFKP